MPEPTNALFCVGVGASAGGLEALGDMFTDAPKIEGIVYLVVTHLAPERPSQMVELLQKRTRLQVEAATNGRLLESGKIWVVAPNTILSSHKKRLRVETGEQKRQPLRPIDYLFESIAEDWGARAAVVVLSGTGTDGTRGARAVKEAGGFVIAQQPHTASFEGMPKSLIDSGLVDLVLDPRVICSEVGGVLAVGIARTASETGNRDSPEFTRILAALNKHARVDFSHYKPATVARRIDRRRGIVRAKSLFDYAERVERDAQEAQRLCSDLLVGVTQFFREPECILEFSTFLHPHALPRW